MNILDAEEQQIFLNAININPQNVIAHYMANLGFLTVFCIGDPADCDAAITQWRGQIAEPMGFGKDAQAMVDLLQQVAGWEVINLPQDFAPKVAPLLGDVRFYGDVYYTLQHPVELSQHPISNVEIRLITLDDIEMVERAPRELRPAMGFISIDTLIQENTIAVGIVDGEIVAISQEVSHAGDYAEIGVFTAEDYRRRGISTYATRLVAQNIQQRGLIPVWSTGEDNWGSHTVAQNVGFMEVSRRTYLIPQQNNAG